MHTLSPKLLKQLVLRSAFDRPEIYYKQPKPQLIEYKAFKNTKPDIL